MGSYSTSIAQVSLLLILFIGLALPATANEGLLDGDVGVTGSVNTAATTTASADDSTARADATVAVDATVSTGTAVTVHDRVNARVDDFKMRMKAREEQFKETRDRLNARMVQIRTSFMDAKTNWLDIRAKIRANASVDRGESFEAAKAFALRSNENVQNYLERLKIRVDIQLEEADAVTINRQIDAQVAILAELSTQIEATTDAASLKALLPEIREAQHDAKVLGKKVVGLLLVEVAQKRVEHVQGIHDRIELRMQVLKDDGLDTTRVEAQLTEAQTNLDEATAAIATAQATFGAEVAADASADTSFKEGQAALREAHQQVNEALVNLRSAVKALIELTPRVNSTTTVAVETAAEVTA